MSAVCRHGLAAGALPEGRERYSEVFHIIIAAYNAVAVADAGRTARCGISAQSATRRTRLQGWCATEQSLREAVFLLRSRADGTRAVSAYPAAQWIKNPRL